MKKVVFLLLALFCAFSVYSSTREIGIKINPYALQIVTKSDVDEDPILSTGGFGAELIAKKYVNKGIFVEGMFDWNKYYLPEDRHDLNCLSAFLGIGNDVEIKNLKIKDLTIKDLTIKDLTIKGSLSLSTHFALGVDILIYNGIKSAVITCKEGLGLKFDLDDRFAVTAGCDGTFGFANKDDFSYGNYSIVPSVGISVKF